MAHFVYRTNLQNSNFCLVSFPFISLFWDGVKPYFSKQTKERRRHKLQSTICNASVKAPYISQCVNWCIFRSFFTKSKLLKMHLLTFRHIFTSLRSNLFQFWSHFRPNLGNLIHFRPIFVQFFVQFLSISAHSKPSLIQI